MSANTSLSGIPLPLPKPLLTRLNLHTLSPQQLQNAIFVANLSQNANIKHLSDFFGFCGVIEKIIVGAVRQKGPEGSIELTPSSPSSPSKASSSSATTTTRHIFAVIVFGNQSAHKMALLLSNAVIIDKPIQVRDYRMVLPPNMARSIPKWDPNAGGSTGMASLLPADRSAVSVVQSLFQHGYFHSERLVDSMVTRARTLDEKLRIGAANSSVGLKSLSDRSMESLKNTKGYIDNTWKSVDDRLKLSDKADTAKTGLFVAGVQAKEQLTRANSSVKSRLQQLEMEKRLKSTSDQFKSRVQDLKVDERLKNVNESMQTGLMSGWSYFKKSLNNVVGQLTGEEEEEQRRQQARRTTPPSSHRQNQETLPDALAGDDFGDIPVTSLSDSDEDGSLDEDDLFTRPSMNQVQNEIASEEAGQVLKGAGMQHEIQTNLLDLGIDESEGTPTPQDEDSNEKQSNQQDLLSFDGGEKSGAKEENMLSFD